MDFDALAAQWDDNPIRRGLTEALAKAMSKALPQTGMSTALEIGCGTGTLALTLAGRFERILATDASLGMVEQLNRKLAETPVDGTIEPMHIDLLTTPPPPGRYDLVYSAMALHHVEDAGRLVSVMAELVRRGGVAIVADLSPEDGSFHAPETVPHNGIAEAQLREWFGVNDLTTRSCETVHTISKGGRDYPVFLAVASRDPALTGAVFRGDPCAPVDADDWPEDLR
ncbi:MAG: class I SAM-dependent methyltransferase [Lentisphaerae bacterium]|jgi:2-polyprenyl-3-methyl-5-hydroxy-6-metoxy-1,4-benzoquinol methylase|nr:class I SAM-dependent methyltransferase [Lentisphaerota bacterium]MBT4816093.1 class I SAM-dependent methyltransferase [Lentisphaerota bacterium]MBT5610858.1 class I SAM-dependent methyltransferase [Lentisphaerota bacterium]MBT7053710.1 class I SAM-dependent methyltransferase [Lentisphaerota bacterium]